MGAWSHESFGNDDAMDWTEELETKGLRAVKGAVSVVEETIPDYLEAPVCSVALAAAEVIAALRGKPAAELPDQVRMWVAGHAGNPGDLVKSAQRAVDAILAQSELRELWEESGEFEAWAVSVRDLRERLA